MISRSGSVILLIILMVTLEVRHASSQQLPPCPPVPTLEVGTTSVATKTALDAVGKLLGRLGIDVDVRTTRDNVLRENPRADQVIIVLTMANIYCKMIWSDTALKGEEKASRFQSMMQQILMPVLGPTPVARTSGHGTSHRYREEGLIVLASNDISAALAQADNEPEFKLPKPPTGFLRDRPFLINDYNKYFVIVGSAPTREEGLHRMNSFKSKEPQYDFALYEPYGANPNYGIMMASWVPRDVALKALRLARRSVARDAYLWACPSSGDSC